MSQRWAALPRGTRWLIGITAVVLALAIVWALFVPAADWLARQDVGSVKGSLHETALDNARGRAADPRGRAVRGRRALVHRAEVYPGSRRAGDPPVYRGY